MQKNTQELIDSELLDTLKKNYYFELEEKFRLYQRASFLFVLLVPMFAVLISLFDNYDNFQPLTFLFLVPLTFSLVFSMGFLFRSLHFHTYDYIGSPKEIIQYYEYEKEYNEYVRSLQKSDKNHVPFIKKLITKYEETIIKNTITNDKRAILLRRSTISMAFFAVILLIFFICVFIEKWLDISFYKYLANFFCLCSY